MGGKVSVNSEFTFLWFKQNVTIRKKVLSNYKTNFFPLLQANGPMRIDFASYAVQIKCISTQFSTVFNNFLPTTVGLAIVITRPTNPPGELSLLNSDEVGNNLSLVSLYTFPNDVIDGAMFTFDVNNDSQTLFGSFVDSNYPGPIQLNTGDSINLAVISSDNFDNPKQSQSSTFTLITGTFNYQIETPLEEVNPINMRSQKQLDSLKNQVCNDNSKKCQ